MHESALVPPLPSLSPLSILSDHLIHTTYPASTLEPLLEMNNTSLMVEYDGLHGSTKKEKGGGPR